MDSDSTVIATLATTETKDDAGASVLLASKPPNNNNLWPDFRTALLTKLVGEGVSATQIALRLGVTRNAVVGKKWRLRLQTRQTAPSSSATAAKAAQRRAKRAAKEREKRRKADYITARKQPTRPEDIYMGANNHDIASLGIPLEQLRWNGTQPTNCRAIVSADGAQQTLYCGLPNWQLESYCAGHCLRFFNRFNPGNMAGRKMSLTSYKIA